MTVSPCPADSFIDSKKLYQFLTAIQKCCLKNHSKQIVSISVKVDWSDPLLIFERIAVQDKIHFYWEHPFQKKALIAIDAVVKLETSGSKRFHESENFVKNCLQEIKYFPDNHRENTPFFSPHFFCSFSFFDYSNLGDYPFPEARVFLPRWQWVIQNDNCWLIANSKIDENTSINEFLNDFRKIISDVQILKSQSYNNQVLPESKFTKKLVSNPNNFKLSVLSALESIKSNHLSKVVLAQALDISSNNCFNLHNSLNNLRILHPNCYVFSTSNGKGQNFIGASPERLISIHQQHLVTDALAGSAPRGQNPIEDEENARGLIYSQKERHEHSLVIDFIVQRLSQLNLAPQVRSPKLRKLSNIQHLWTPIEAVVGNEVHPLQIIAQLHPTPAVAGVNPDIACKEIRRYENFERGLYAAPLGWIDSLGNSEFIVGIRSALIDNQIVSQKDRRDYRARLYAGNGIVFGSNPQQELMEIELKFQCLLKALE